MGLLNGPNNLNRKAQGNCLVHHITAPKKNTLKKWVHIKLHFGSLFLEYNNLFQIIFFRMYYFQFWIFFIRNGILIFFSGFLYPKHKKLFRIYFSEMHYFQFWIFISRKKNIFGIFEIILGAGSSGCRSICQSTTEISYFNEMKKKSARNENSYCNRENIENIKVLIIPSNYEETRRMKLFNRLIISL